MTCSRLAPTTCARKKTFTKLAFNLKAPHRFGGSWPELEWRAFRLLRRSHWVWLVLLSPEAAHAQEYPWCVSRESYLDCAYTTHEQCQWTASGIGGCALNPRLLFPNTPGHPEAKSRNQPRDLLSRMY